MIGFPRPLGLSERLRLSFRTGKGRMGAMLKRGKLTQSFADCVPLFIALGDSTRLTIIQHLYEALPDGGSCPAQGLNVKEITEQTSLSRPAISHHLKVLKESGLIDVRRQGVCNYYYLTIETAISKLACLKDELQNACTE